MSPRLQRYSPYYLHLLIILFFLTRLVNLTLLPIFSDEAVYVEWAWRMTHVPGLAFHSLQDGKQPLLMWIFGLFQNFFSDPLLASRLVSVLFGSFNLWGIYYLAGDVFNKKTAVVSALLYIFIPFFFFFDRQALMESSLVSVYLLTFIFLLRFYRSPGYLTAAFPGIILGFGFLNKSTPVLFLLALFIIHALYLIRRRSQIVSFTAFTLVTLTCFFLVNIPMLIQPVFWKTLYRTGDYALPLPQLLRFPLITWISNFINHLEILILNFTPVALIAAILGITSLVKNPDFKKRLLVLWITIPLLLYFLTIRHTNDLSFRYLTPFVPLLILPAAYYLSFRFFLTVVALVLPVFFTLQLMFYPVSYFRIKSRLTRYSYIGSYVTGYDTGYQVNALRSYINEVSRDRPIILATAVHTFNPESALAAYYRRYPRVQFAYLDGRLIGEETIGAIDCISSDLPVYFIAKLDDKVNLDKFLEKVTVITNPYNFDYSTIYTLKTNCTGQTVRLNLSGP